MTNQKHALLRSGWITTILTVAVGAGLAGTALVIPQPAQAVHDEPTPFQLDGNPTKSILGGNPSVSPLDDDWDNIFDLGDGSGSPAYPSPRNAANALESQGETFVVDTDVPLVVNGKTTEVDLTAFVQSNKDTQDTDTWNWSQSSISPPKDDITDAYAKAYRFDHDANAATPDHTVVYFGSDRYADDGDSAMGYWFFRNAVAPGPNGKFVNKHAVGDVLIQIDYRGSGNNEIEVFKWVGTGGNAGQGTLQRLAIGMSANPADTICTAANTGIPEDSACITTNVVNRDSPWHYEPKGEDSVGADRFPARVFMEGGFDVTALVGNVCFSGFLAETRTSHSETATLKDFAFGDFDLCSIDIEKACVADSGTANADETFTTNRTITISNTSFAGSLANVEMNDASTTSATTCEIISISSTGATGLAGTGHVFNSTAYFKVADTLTGSITIGLECTSPQNTFQNTANVRASSAVGQPQDITDLDSEPTSGAGNFHACEAALDSGLVLKKWCQGDDGLAADPSNPNPYFSVVDPENPLGASVFLKPPSYAPMVCVDIEVSNPSTNQKMVINAGNNCDATADAGETLDKFCDDKLGSLVPAGGLTLAAAGTVDGLGNKLDRYSVQTCYSPTPDQAVPVGGVLPPLLAHNVTYSDTASASAHGKLDNVRKGAGPVTATCALCADE
jgi:hypothetical protein